MANDGELLILTPSNTGRLKYDQDDGDIIDARNQKAIKRVNAELICRPHHYGFTSDGFRATGGMVQGYYDCASQYRFEVVGTTQINRHTLDSVGNIVSTELIGLEKADYKLNKRNRLKVHKAKERGDLILSEEVGTTVNNYIHDMSVLQQVRDDITSEGVLYWHELTNAQYYRDTAKETLPVPMMEIDVPEYVRRRLKHPRHKMFGSPAQPIWYGGNTDYSQATVDQMWTNIQTHSAHEPSPGPCTHCGQDHSVMIVGNMEVLRMCWVKVADFNDVEMVAMTATHSKEFLPGETITDPDGATVVPDFTTDSVWEHPTGQWQYVKDESTGIVDVRFSKVSMRVRDWESDVPSQIGKSVAEIRDDTTPIGRYVTVPDIEKTPWMKAQSERDVDRPTAPHTLDHVAFNDPNLLWNKPEQRAGQRRPE